MNFHKISFVNGSEVSLSFKRVLVAKTTHLGDLVISLPMAAALKQRDPTCTVIFLTSQKTVEIARCCPDIDEVYAQPATAEELVSLLASLHVDIFIQANSCRETADAAYHARIPIRIGSLFRFYNFRRCTHLVPLSRSRRINKRLLDLQYLLPLGIKIEDEHAVASMYDLRPPRICAERSQIHPDRFAAGRRTIILCPSMITAQCHQWPLESYTRLIRSLDPAKFHWFICGATGDRDNLRPLLEQHSRDPNVTDLVGKLTMTEFMSFITCCDGLVAGSTGPLHLAAALGIRTLGLYQSRKADRERWRPIGRSTSIIHSDVRCRGERKTAPDRKATCPCIAAISPERVAQQLRRWFETS